MALPPVPPHRQSPGGLRVSTAIMQNTISTVAFPAKFQAPTLEPGYQAAHAHFIEMREHLARQAYSTQEARVIIVKVRMMTHAPGKVKPILISVSVVFTLTLW